MWTSDEGLAASYSFTNKTVKILDGSYYKIYNIFKWKWETYDWDPNSDIAKNQTVTDFLGSLVDGVTIQNPYTFNRETITPKARGLQVRCVKDVE